MPAATSPTALQTLAALTQASLLMAEHELQAPEALQAALAVIADRSNRADWASTWSEMIGAARSHQKRTFAETSQAPDFPDALKTVLAGQRTTSLVSTAPGGSSLPSADLGLDPLAHVASHTDGGGPVNTRSALQESSGQVRTLDAAGDSQDESATVQLDRQAKRLMAERGLTYHNALLVAADESVTIPSTPIQASQAARPGVDAFGRSSNRDRSGETGLAAPTTYAERLQNYAFVKQTTLGKPAPVRLSPEQARTNAGRLGEQFRMSEGPAQRVIFDHKAETEAAEALMTQRYRDRGERLTFKEALRRISRGQR